MGVAVAQPVSPELVLVCPELRERALELLPAIDPDALFAVEPRPAQSVAVEQQDEPRPAQPVAVEQHDEPRPTRLAIALYFVEALALGTLRATGIIAVIAVVAFLLSR